MLISDKCYIDSDITAHTWRIEMAQSQSERFVAAKRALLLKLYRKMNEMQRQAIFCVDGPLLVLAGAGSGKTTVLVNRIAHIIRYGRIYDSDRLPDGFTEADLESLEAAARS